MVRNQREHVVIHDHHGAVTAVSGHVEDARVLDPLVYVVKVLRPHRLGVAHIANGALKDGHAPVPGDQGLGHHVHPPCDVHFPGVHLHGVGAVTPQTLGAQVLGVGRDTVVDTNGGLLHTGAGGRHDDVHHLLRD